VRRKSRANGGLGRTGEGRRERRTGYGTGGACLSEVRRERRAVVVVGTFISGRRRRASGRRGRRAGRTDGGLEVWWELRTYRHGCFCGCERVVGV
jgi:hypothetical protein